MVYAHLAHALSLNDIEKTGLLLLNRTQNHSFHKIMGRL